MIDAAGPGHPPDQARAGQDCSGAQQTGHSGRHASLGRTVAACLLVLVGFAAAVSTLTQDYTFWTFEERRRAAAARGELQAPVIRMRDSRGSLGPLLNDPAATATLVDFFYTRCPSVCQALGSEFSQMQQALQRNADPGVRLLSVSIDPAHDDTAALASYGQQHSADSRWWRIAAPVTPAGHALLLSQLGVVAVPDGFGGFVHNGDIHLIDREGRLRQVFDYADWQRALAAARQVSHEGTP